MLPLPKIWVLALLLGLALCLGWVVLGGNPLGNTASEKYAGLSKEELWARLCRQSGSKETPITAFDFAPGAEGTRHAMVTVSDAGRMPEIFRTARKWRWDSPERHFHEFFFNARGRVEKVVVDTSSRL